MSGKPKLYTLSNDGVPHRVHTVPAWATHIVKKKDSGGLYFARHQYGEEEWYTGPGATHEFHPDGYEPYMQGPFNQDAMREKFDMGFGSVHAKASDVPQKDPFIGETWFVRLPGRDHLTECHILHITHMVAKLRYPEDGYTYSRTYSLEDIIFYETVPG